MSNYKHRAGKFFIPHREIERYGLGMLPLFARVVILECRYDYCRAGYEYVGLSPDFDEIMMGDKAPEYEWILTYDSGTKITHLEARRLG